MVATLAQVVVELRVEESGSTERHLPLLDPASRQSDKLHAPAEDKRVPLTSGIRDFSYRLGHAQSVEDAERRVKVAGGENDVISDSRAMNRLCFDGQAGEQPMATITYDLPPSAFAALHLSPKEFAREMRVAACVQWYAQGLVSQERAAEIAGLSRAEFIEELFRRRVPACQVTLEELIEEIEHE